MTEVGRSRDVSNDKKSYVRSLSFYGIVCVLVTNDDRGLISAFDILLSNCREICFLVLEVNYRMSLNSTP